MKLTSYFRLANTRSRQRSNVDHFNFCKFSIAVIYPFNEIRIKPRPMTISTRSTFGVSVSARSRAFSLSSFSNHVGRIICCRSAEQMAWVVACAVVAGVTSKQRMRVDSGSQEKRQSMDGDGSLIHLEFSVPFRSNAVFPRPAIVVIAYFNKFKEMGERLRRKGGQWSTRSGHLIPPMNRAFLRADVDGVRSHP